MLVLSRKAGDKIKIGKDIVINILKIEGGTIRIGIEAPPKVVILRMEVFEKIQNENIDSVSKGVDEITDAIELIKNKLPKE
ncbi:MAG: carbon storage regulator CsrA [Desulfobacula sp.]|jgi:carbon storage regulator|nr:carbon storage regulator CsrA [Desulfobacula sp.]